MLEGSGLACKLVPAYYHEALEFTFTIVGPSNTVTEKVRMVKEIHVQDKLGPDLSPCDAVLEKKRPSTAMLSLVSTSLSASMCCTRTALGDTRPLLLDQCYFNSTGTRKPTRPTSTVQLCTWSIGVVLRMPSKILDFTGLIFVCLFHWLLMCLFLYVGTRPFPRSSTIRTTALLLGDNFLG
ncbi:hypothetical protein DFH29DRAFT_875405 [Suillus ampliporus]|nr:hypothetical protein DFH29DRAFT_875405 [Suillus ampliporus]